MALPVRRSSSPGATVERWDPFREMQELHSRTEQVMESLLAGTGAGNGGVWAPLVDIEETDDAWVVDLELPSVDRKDIHVELRDKELVVTGAIKEKERKGVVRRRTRRTGDFEYRVTLPGNDQSAGALAGTSWMEGGVEAGNMPIWPNISLGDTGNGYLSAIAILQALAHRERTGEGQFVHTSIVNAHLLNASMASIGADGVPADRPQLDAGLERRGAGARGCRARR